MSLSFSGCVFLVWVLLGLLVGVVGGLGSVGLIVGGVDLLTCCLLLICDVVWFVDYV